MLINVGHSFIINFYYLCILSLFLCVNCSILNAESKLNNTPENWLQDKPKDLRDMNKWELSNFLNSFDIVITDINGVLWHGTLPAIRAVDTLKKLTNCNKQIYFISNNSLFPVKYYIQLLDKLEYHAYMNEFIVPSSTVLWYLKKIRFQGKAFVIGTEIFKEQLIDNGIDIVTGPISVEEDLAHLENVTQIDKDVKAVIIGLDVNMNWAKLVLAGIYLQNKNIMFLAGASNKWIEMTKSQIVLGAGYFIDILEEYTDRKPILLVKPGHILKEFIFEKFNITNPKRVLFIGDSLKTDIKFAERCGFIKLWVGSGVDSLETREKDNKITPDFYLPDVSQLSSFDCFN